MWMSISALIFLSVALWVLKHLPLPQPLYTHKITKTSEWKFVLYVCIYWIWVILHKQKYKKAKFKTEVILVFCVLIAALLSRTSSLGLINIINVVNLIVRPIADNNIILQQEACFKSLEFPETWKLEQRRHLNFSPSKSFFFSYHHNFFHLTQRLHYALSLFNPFWLPIPYSRIP